MPPNLPDVQELYAKDPKLKKEDVDLIFEWLKTQPHLPQLEEFQVIMFLHSCRHDIESTKKTIDIYFTLRTSSPLFKDLSEDLFKKTLSYVFLGFMPKRTPDGDAVYLSKLFDTRAELFNCTEQAKVILAISTLYCHQMSPANGLIIVSDTAGTSFSHFIKVNFSDMRQLTHFMQEAAPVRIKSIHYLNSNSLTARIVGLLKPFVKKEIYETLNFHTNSLEGLYKSVPKECLPEDYGGTLPPTEVLKEKNLQNLLDNMSFFEWHDTQKVDETKRIKENKGFFAGIQRMFRSE